MIPYKEEIKCNKSPVRIILRIVSSSYLVICVLVLGVDENTYESILQDKQTQLFKSFDKSLTFDILSKDLFFRLKFLFLVHSESLNSFKPNVLVSIILELRKYKQIGMMLLGGGGGFFPQAANSVRDFLQRLQRWHRGFAPQNELESFSP